MLAGAVFAWGGQFAPCGSRLNHHARRVWPWPISNGAVWWARTAVGRWDSDRAHAQQRCISLRGWMPSVHAARARVANGSDEGRCAFSIEKLGCI
ncbi:hypothetical protein FHS23_001020 [Prauserella isguenensis]|uniref:Uncharacterized protein n=1 Tax=Prauserella isguenensis TaxID=1470180 RepID=A0A839RXV9_9PSEU|nr:hypothetical protein [Prauserella isguenensis]